MNRAYELMFVLRPDMTDKDLARLVSHLGTATTAALGTVKSVKLMGKRPLPHTLSKFREGFYVVMTIQGTGAVVRELERRLRSSGKVLKFLTMRIDEGEKRQEKTKNLLDAMKKSGPRQTATEEALPTAETYLPALEKLSEFY